MSKTTYSIARDYTKSPGPRYKKQGKFSGEDFLETVLLDLFDTATKSGYKLEINLDYTNGYGPSFLEESFGGLARIRNKDLIKSTLIFVSKEEPNLIIEINEYIRNATTKEL